MKYSGSARLPRVLVVHNRYLHRGGEDVVVDAEIALLRAKGHDVALFERSSEQLSESPLSMARELVWNSKISAELEQAAAAFDPDVVHVHNTFPFISPAAYTAVQGRPVVQTLHNFRLLCPQAMLLRKGKVCEDCVGKMPWRGVLHGCYRSSRMHSAAIAGMLVAHRAIGTWRTRVTRYVALNEFGRIKFIEGGLPAGRISVKPNFVDAPSLSLSEPREGFLFVGRLAPEKGIGLLAEAAISLAGSASVRVAGSGPEDALLVTTPNVKVLGALSAAEVMAEMSRAQALVMPSLWYETFGLVIIEAFAAGLPVIASRLGSMATLVREGKTGLLFEPGNVNDLVDKLRWALTHPHDMAIMGAQARAEYEALYTPSRNYVQLMDIYKEAMADAEQDAG